MVRSESKPWEMPGKYDVSPYNYAEEVLADYDFPPMLPSGRFPIQESTIRKMDNTPGSLIPYSIEDKLEIAAMLDDMGIAEISFNPMHFYGTPRTKAINEAMEAIAKKGFNFNIYVNVNWVSWVDGNFKEHADRIIGQGAQSFDVEAIGSERFRRMYLRDWTWQQIADESAKAVEYVRSKGIEAGIDLGDYVRGDVDQMIGLMNFWINHGAQRFHISDSFGSLAPQGTRYLIKKIRSGLIEDTPIVYHPHDDTGLATANALAATAAGAWPDISVNGIGERAFAKLEEVVLSLELLYGVDTGLKLEKLTELSRLVERITGIPNQPHKPVVGETMYVPLFQDEYIDLLKGGPYVSTAFAPEIVGQKPALVWWEGMMTEVTVRAKLEQMGLPYTEEQVGKVMQALSARLRALKKFPAWIPDDEAGDICRRALG